MNIAGLSSSSGIGAVGNAQDRGPIAAEIADEIGQRVVAWLGGGSPRTEGTASGFVPDRAELARGGDVYGLKQMAGDIGARLGATPVQQGALERALVNFTRVAVVQVAGLSGAPADRQTAGLAAALGNDGGGNAAAGVDAVIGQLETAASALGAANG